MSQTQTHQQATPSPVPSMAVAAADILHPPGRRMNTIQTVHKQIMALVERKANMLFMKTGELITVHPVMFIRLPVPHFPAPVNRDAVGQTERADVISAHQSIAR